MYRTPLPLPAVWIENALPASTVLGKLIAPLCARACCIVARTRPPNSNLNAHFMRNRPNFMSRFRALTTDCVVMSGGTDMASQREMPKEKRSVRLSTKVLRCADLPGWLSESRTRPVFPVLAQLMPRSLWRSSCIVAKPDSRAASKICTLWETPQTVYGADRALFFCDVRGER